MIAHLAGPTEEKNWTIQIQPMLILSCSRAKNLWKSAHRQAILEKVSILFLQGKIIECLEDILPHPSRSAIQDSTRGTSSRFHPFSAKLTLLSSQASDSRQRLLLRAHQPHGIFSSVPWTHPLSSKFYLIDRAEVSITSRYVLQKDMKMPPTGGNPTRARG